jgi:hypothetical protein
VSAINVTVNPTIQKTVVVEVSPNQVILADANPSATYIASEISKTVEVGNAAPNLSEYVKNSQTGDFLTSGTANELYYPLSNPSGYATGVDASSLVSKASFNVFTGKFIKFTSYLSSGLSEEFISYPLILSSTPIISCEIQNDMDNLIYNYHIKGVNTSGFTIGYSDFLSNSGYKLHIEAQLL